MLLAAALTLYGCTPDYKALYNSVVEELSQERYQGRSVRGDGDLLAARYLIDCLSDDEACGKSCSCATRIVWRKVRDGLNQIVDGITLQDILDRQRENYANDYMI